MSEFTFLQVHFHEFSPTNTAPLLGKGGSASEVNRRESATDAELDEVPIEEAEATDDESESGGPGVAPLVALFFLVVAVAVARKAMGGDDELEALEELETVE